MVKVGDIVIILNNTRSINVCSHYLLIGSEAVITQVRDGCYEALGISNRNPSYQISQTIYQSHFELKTDNMNITKGQMKDAVEKVANSLAVKNGKITTLELKDELRSVYPAVLWNQYQTNGVFGVSDLFHDLVNEGKFKSIANNGTYQTYLPTNFKPATTVTTTKLVTAIAKANPTKGKITRTKVVKTPVFAQNPIAPATPLTKISRSKALDLIKNNKGHFFTATFIKQDGTERTMNCQYSSKIQINIELGYIAVKEASKLKAQVNPIRQINMQTLSLLKIAGNTYKVK